MTRRVYVAIDPTDPPTDGEAVVYQSSSDTYVGGSAGGGDFMADGSVDIQGSLTLDADSSYDIFEDAVRPANIYTDNMVTPVVTLEDAAISDDGSAGIDFTTGSGLGAGIRWSIDSSGVLVPGAGTPYIGEVANPVGQIYTTNLSATGTIAGIDASDVGARGSTDDHTHQSTGAQAGQLDHGLALTGLTDDDHTQYLLADGSRDIAGDFVPDADGTRDLGNTTDRFAEAHVDAVYTDLIDDAGGAAGVGFTVGGFPSTDSALDWGKSGKTWQHVWAEGIQFPATQVASADANNLDDYEEGDWTPEVRFGGATTGITYTSRGGSYTKIGRLVFCSFAIVMSSKGSATGTADIYGLPYASSSSEGARGGGQVFETGNMDWLVDGIIVLRVISGDTGVRLRKQQQTGTTLIVDSNFTNTSYLYGSFTYMVA